MRYMRFGLSLLLILIINFFNLKVYAQTYTKPIVVNIENRPKPQQIFIPANGETKYYLKQGANRSFVYKLYAPKTFFLPLVSKNVNQNDNSPFKDQTAAGLGFFTNYTTDNGLALDAVFCSTIDRFGNIWFGTDGGGVSCYDGKSFTNYSKANGMLNNSVFSIAVDKKGNIWIGTHGGGVSCYDGKSFKNYTVLQGLADNYINCIYEDKKGNIWFGTDKGGLSCFNGKIFINYSTQQGLADSNIRSIAEDIHGNLWFGTHNGGVSCLPKKTDTSTTKMFINYSTVQKNGFNSVFSIVEDNCGNLWFATFGGGISCFDGKTFTNYTIKDGLASNYVRTIIKDKEGDLWVGTRDGGISNVKISCSSNINIFNNKQKTLCISFTNYSTNQGLANNNVRSILEDRTGNLWFSTGGGGISRYDGRSFINYTINQGLANNYLRSIGEDKNGNVWFGAWNGGVSCFNGNSFTTYTVSQGLANDYVNTILNDKNGNLWFGTNSGGVSFFDGKSFTNYSTLQGLIGNCIITSFQDSKGIIWFGTFGKGLSCFDGRRFINFSKGQGLLNDTILCIAEDKNEYLWFGTSGGGLFSFNLNSFNNNNPSAQSYFTNYTTKQGLAYNIVYSLTVDKAGNLWIGTAGGGVSRLLAKDLKENFIKNNHIYKSEEIFFKNIYAKIGLSSDVIDGIVEDKMGKIIIGTNMGLTVLVPTDVNNGGKIITKGEEKAWTFYIYNSKTGYPVKDINGGCNNNGAMFCDSKGIIWIGTGSDKTALVRFNPNEIRINLESPKLVLQSIKVNNENISWYNLKGDLLKQDSAAMLNEEIIIFGKSLSFSERKSMKEKFKDIAFSSISNFYPIPENLVLPYKNNNITFEYAAIEPSRPYLVKYQYILEGYDKEWNPITNKTSASFGNISEGTYTFKIKACSPDNVWSKPISYTFKVLPPWYRNWWMYPIYFILIAILIWGLIKRRIVKLNNEKDNLEEKVKLRTTQLEIANQEIKQNIAIVEKTAQIKQQFLANMSHEIRTPMNVIMGMINLVNKTDLNETQADYVQTIQAASENLLSIINDILDLNKIEAGKMMLKNNSFDIIETANKINKLFKETAINKNLDFKIIKPPEKSIFILADENRILQIICNLISNAFKFTVKGSVIVRLLIVNNTNKEIKFKIEVEDTGIGIKDEDQNRLFAKFSQLDNTMTRNHEGTGLGLAISKDLVLLMNGEIGVNSEYGHGSLFWFTFVALISSQNELEKDQIKPVDNFKLPFTLSVLLVEDKFINQKVEKLILENIGCIVEVANNGKEAVEIISSNKNFDIVFMDIQMPIMDGVEAVSILRKKFDKLPVIIGLSANALEGDAEKYISLGMDDYVSKPFTNLQIKEKLFKWFKNKKANTLE